jgi:tRNA (guanine10-N2)-dimethyltransferase
MNQSMVILGRQPALGLAELERLYGADSLHPIHPQIALLDVEVADVDFARLGGTVKLAKVLTRLDTTAWPKVIRYLAKTAPDHLQYLPEGKLRLGLNAYGLAIKLDELNRSGLEVKKAIKKAGRSVRVVPNTTLEISSAQTLHNQLTGPTGWEFVLVRDGDSTVVAQVVAAQDINAYAARDQMRPKRDARVGMLPPKLAQTIINLSGAQPDQTVLDPFCGTGVILQEALLDGCSAYGSDLEPRMIEYTQANLDWLGQKYADLKLFALETGDACTHQWSQPFQTVAAETYLGRPFTTEPDADILNQTIREVDTIHKKFLRNLARQTQPGLTACLALPAWKTRNGFKHLPCLDSLEELGYTRVSFVHSDDASLVYHREGQIVGRELVVLIRK